MEAPRIFAVGDIHGCRLKLDRLLAKLDWRPENQERLVFLGDYIDRGPDSYGVVETVLGLKNLHPNEVILLRGNHERMFENFLLGQEELVLTANGVALTFSSYINENNYYPFPQTHLQFYQDLLLYYETTHHIFVHAGLRPGVPLASQREVDCLWIRDEFLLSDHDFGKTIVFGHTPMRQPFICPGRAGLDTGAVFGGPLTCLEVTTGELYSA
ncbi:MAG: serine/threonine protein phosphatase [Deltaproteobacteria bacterium]|jgi:serine/threonine protein phosphatase 1|nr:serine/threonine protein phosphatase [Deltaproteobacteria bacterium]